MDQYVEWSFTETVMTTPCGSDSENSHHHLCLWIGLWQKLSEPPFVDWILAEAAVTTVVLGSYQNYVHHHFCLRNLAV